MAQQNPWDNDPIVRPATGSAPRVLDLPPSARDQRDEARKDRDEARKDRDANRTAANEAERLRLEKERIARDQLKDKQGQEYQAKSSGFYGRMLQSQQDYSTAKGDALDPRGTIRQYVHDKFPNLENEYLNDTTRQAADQAARNFIAAQLRLESGAAISPEEFENQYRIFYPMPGDAPEVIAQKAAARKQATEAMRMAAGPLAQDAAQTIQPSVNIAGSASTGANIPLIPGGPGGNGQPMQFAQGKRYSTPEDLALAQAIQAAYNKGGSVKDMAAAAYAFGYKVSPQDIAQWSEAVKYRDNPGRKGPLSSVQPRQSGVRGAIEQGFGNFASSPAGAFLTGAADQMVAGSLDEITGGINSVLSGRSYDLERDLADMGKQAQREVNGGAYLGGQFAGGIGQGILGGQFLKGYPAAQKVMQSLPGMLGSGAVYGGVNGAFEDNADRTGGAIKGAGAGLLGAAAGRYVLGPIAESFMRQSSPQAASEFVRGALRRLPGMESRVAAKAVIPQFSPGERMIQPDPQAIRVNLQDAARLGLPYGLVDADPALRNVGGSAARISPNARVLAEETFAPRAAGQAERAFDAVDTHLAPIPDDIAARGKQWKQAAQTESGPFYEMGKGRPAPVDDRVAAFLNTPAGKDALKQAYTLAGNEGRNPQSLGFDLNDQGEVILRDLPSWETLDLVKRGFDQQLAPFRNPVTNKLDLEGNPAASALENLRKRFVHTLDELNPDYAKARAAYEAQIRNRTALDAGANATKMQVKPRDISRITDGYDATQTGEFQRGFASSLGDSINDARINANPYDRIYGTPNQREKIGMVYPEGAENFDRVYRLEQDMGNTRGELIGGSPTASRQQADASFLDSGLGQAMDVGMQVATGGGVSPVGIARLAKATVGDRLKMGLTRKAAEEKANNVAGILFNTDPNWALNYLDDLAVRRMQDTVRKQAFARRGALLGTSIAVPITGTLGNH